jgi:hypothetical protein
MDLTPIMMHQNYLNSALKQFGYYKTLGERTFDQLNEKQLFWQYNSESNSIAIIINHLWGNMKSRWTDFLTSDGEKKWRKRDLEFETQIESKEKLMAKWEAGWTCLFEALQTINDKNFQTEIFIRNQSHSIPDAVNRQMMHYAYHIGQVVYLGRMIKAEKWKNLSVEKGGSAAYNQKKNSQGEHRGHFTDDI